MEPPLCRLQQLYGHSIDDEIVLPSMFWLVWVAADAAAFGLAVPLIFAFIAVMPEADIPMLRAAGALALPHP